MIIHLKWLRVRCAINSGIINFVYCKAGMTAVIPALPFHDKGPGDEQPFAAVSLQLSRSRWSSNDPFPVQHRLSQGIAVIHQFQ